MTATKIRWASMAIVPKTSRVTLADSCGARNTKNRKKRTRRKTPTFLHVIGRTMWPFLAHRFRPCPGFCFSVAGQAGSVVTVL